MANFRWALNLISANSLWPEHHTKQWVKWWRKAKYKNGENKLNKIMNISRKQRGGGTLLKMSSIACSKIPLDQLVPNREGEHYMACCFPDITGAFTLLYKTLLQHGILRKGKGTKGKGDGMLYLWDARLGLLWVLGCLLMWQPPKVKQRVDNRATAVIYHQRF